MKLKQFFIASLCLFIIASTLPQTTQVIASDYNQEMIIYRETEDKAMRFLEQLDMETSFVFEGTITRAAFTSYAMNLAYNGNLRGYEEGIFKDVTVDNEYSKEIYMAYAQGIISKSEYFRPDDAIKYSEAMVILVKTLGYGIVAETQGGYPLGYIACADSIKLSKGIQKQADDVLSGKDTLLLLYNMLNTELMLTDFGTAGSVKIQSSNKTILTENYNLHKVEGLVTATMYSSLNEMSDAMAENHISINGNAYSYLYENDTVELLGMNVEAYIDDEDVAVIVCPINNKTIKIEKAENYKDYVVEYEDDNRLRKLELDRSFCFIYNGKAYNDYLSTDFTEVYGSLEFIDNNKDNKYDVVYATDIDYLSVRNVDKLNKIIYGNSVLREYINFDIDDGHFWCYKENDGNWQPIKMSDIVMGDLLAVMISKDNKIGKIIVCEKKLSGKIDEMNDDFVKIDGVEYKRSKYYETFHSVSVGEKGTFYVGLKDDIVSFVSAGSDEYKYGYLIKTMRDTMEDKVYLRIMDENGDSVRLECQDKIRLDGKSIRVGQHWANNMLPLTDETDYVKRQLIKYKLKDNQVYAIDTVEDVTSLDLEVNDSNDSLRRYYSSLSTAFKGNGMNSFLRFSISSSTKIFIVPNADVADVEDKDFGVSDMSYFVNDRGYIVDAYDFDENGIPKLVICYSEFNETVRDTSQYGVVEKIRQVWHEEDGCVYHEIELWSSGEFLTFYVETDNEDILKKNNGKMVGIGDLIRVSHRNGIVKALTLDFDAEMMEFTDSGNSLVYKDASYSKMRSYVLASIYRIMGNNYFVSWTKNQGVYDYSLENLRAVNVNKAANIIVVDSSLHPIYPEEILDFYSGGYAADEVLLIQGYWSCSNIIIYRR